MFVSACAPSSSGVWRRGGLVPQGACVPPPPPDLDCKDIGHKVTVIGDDPHSLDSNHDGVACEGEG